MPDLSRRHLFGLLAGAAAAPAVVAKAAPRLGAGLTPADFGFAPIEPVARTLSYDELIRPWLERLTAEVFGVPRELLEPTSNTTAAEFQWKAEELPDEPR